jgi:two-component system, OmpR family, response regulator
MPTILFADDEPAIRDIVARYLELGGHRVQLASNGAEALEQVRRAMPDLVVLDYQMGNPDGFQVCRHLKNSPRFGHLPVMILTGQNTLETRLAGFDAGADDYLAKPFVLEELLARLRALARRGPVARPTVLAVGDLRLDPAARTVTRAGTEIELTPREFSVLHALMRRPGEVVSRQDLVDEVWDFSYEAGSNVVDVYIGYLRRKVDRPFETEMIETVRGVGYRLAEPA